MDINMENILNIQDCRNAAYEYLENASVNYFSKYEYFENDKNDQVGEKQYELLRNILFDALMQKDGHFQNANQSNKWFNYLEDEIYKFFSKDEKYAKDSVYLTMVLAGFSSELANYIISAFNISFNIAYGLASLTIYTIIKLGANSWCEKYKKDHNL